MFTTPDGLKLVGIGGSDGQGILDCGFGVWAWNDAEGIANAELVVKAVNSHDALVNALQSLADNPFCDPDAVAEFARAALSRVTPAIQPHAENKGLDQ